MDFVFWIFWFERPLHFRAFKPSYTFSWVGRVLPEAKFENKCTLFFEFFDLSDLYIFEHLSLHIHFRGWGGSSQKQNSKINWLFFLFQTLSSFTDISVMVAQIQKIQKTRCILFWILLLGGPSLPSQLVPNPFNWSPNTVFLLISWYW